MSGIMNLTGEPKRQPQKMGIAFMDIFSGLCGVIGSQAALAERARSGLGQHVDISLLDSMTVVFGQSGDELSCIGQGTDAAWQCASQYRSI
jgi:crotonobetainyl-CoA:carnitine CoA-transferase CaiB-like acyl-CoA transferase